MNSFRFTKQAKKAFLKLPLLTQKRVLKKLTELKTHEDVLSVLVRLKELEPATHRFRMGQYRLILRLVHHRLDSIKFWVLDVGHRREVYR